jgi:diguanylate cyclase (GGDEF)-like protein
VAGTFEKNLVALSERLTAATIPSEMSRTEQEIGRELEGWSARASDYYRRKAGEIRDVMVAMNEAAKTVADRDERYRAQFTEVSTRLQQIDDLEDLARIKNIVQHSAGQLRTCVERMMEDGRQSVSRLKTQLAVYQERLQEAERASSTDALTGLLNRAGVEREIENRIRVERPFSLVLLDLNGFKRINDTYGHAAGDAVLQSFAAEFKGQFRSMDVVGRWGGDEFVVLLGCPASEARARIDSVGGWVLGQYSLPGVGKVSITAASGIAEWCPGQTSAQLFSQADQAMYADKKRSPLRGASNQMNLSD